MTDTLFLGTRKGLFTLVRKTDQWTIESVDFIGQTVTMLLDDPRDQTVYVSLTLGHFGSKLHRKAKDETEWKEVAVPVYETGMEIPLGAFATEDGPQTKPATLKEIWSLETCGADQPGSLWAGTIPGGLFRSDDRGESWQIVQSLWDLPERMEWFGGGKDEAEIGRAHV